MKRLSVTEPNSIARQGNPYDHALGKCAFRSSQRNGSASITSNVFKNKQRIQTKTKLTPLEKRNQFAAKNQFFLSRSFFCIGYTIGGHTAISVFSFYSFSAYSGNSTGSILQISLAYSAMVRSAEKTPALHIFSQHLRAKAVGDRR